ncbi:dehydrogenase [Hyphodiscus hymeniophilus]|uniref:Dehydrogenase n=1 Tax=Hyphodiscus hymeniophilus TaxID=353542 RepID=A0A9P6SQ02_9HELO|nr:dehydrogenase [Hyphodiscus hymeniophilus]
MSSNTAMPENTAAWLMAEKANPLVVKSSTYTAAGPNEIVVRTAAVAINPLDWMKQDTGSFVCPWVKYPFVMGSDIAGEVVEVGRGVTRFKVGDRVMGHSVGMDEKQNRSAEGSFQTFTILLAHMASPIPASMSYESACVIPLGASTAACGLFQEDQLNLQYPSVTSKPTGETVIIWGGATSVGLNAIQLAKAAGYEVITTASPKNFELVKHLGATKVFDYRSKTVVADIIRALDQKKVAGALTMGRGAAEACRDILKHCHGKKFIAMATYPSLATPPTSLVLLRTILNFISWNISHWVTCKARGIGSKFIFGTTLAHNGVGKALYENYFPQALADNLFTPSPEPQVIGHGLKFIQPAMDLQKEGVSAKKVVVTL